MNLKLSKQKSESETFLKVSDNDRICYYHNVGSDIHRKIIVLNGRIKKLKTPLLKDRKLFLEIENKCPEIISKEEFESIWNEPKQDVPKFNDVVKDWRKIFIRLKPITNTKICLNAGPILIGLSINSFSGLEYNVRLIIIPLWNLEYLNKQPIFFTSDIYNYKSKKNTTFVIRYDLHYYFYENTEKLAKGLFGSLFLEEVKLSELWSRIDYLYTLNHKSNFPVDIYSYKNYLELKLALAIYFNRTDLIENTILGINRFLKSIEPSRFESTIRFSVNEWMHSLNYWIEHRQEFLDIIEENSKLPKVAKLNKAHIINDPFIPTPLPLLKPQSFWDKLKRFFQK